MYGVAPAPNGEILNGSCHAFHLHAEGVWKSDDKDDLASLIAAGLEARSSITRKLLGAGDRVIKMLTYRAIERNVVKATGPEGPVQQRVVEDTPSCRR